MDPAALSGSLLLSYGLLVLSLWTHNGGLGPFAVLPFLGCLYVVVRIARGRPLRLPGEARLLMLLLGAETALALLKMPGSYLRGPGGTPAPFWPHAVTVLLVAGLAVRGLRRPLHLPLTARRAWLLAAAMAVLVLAEGAWVLHASPAPRIDVFTLQQVGAQELLAGRDPYAALYPNVYTPEESRDFFGAALPHLSHYPYPPLTLLASTASEALLGDVRAVYLAAHVLVGLLLLATARRRQLGLGLCALQLLHPRGLFVVEQSWTEPLVALLAAVLAWLGARRVRTLLYGVVLGMLLAAKQYAVLVLPFCVPARLSPPGVQARRALWVALAVAAATVLPFFAWHPRDFVADVVLFQLQQPFRRDALALPALLSFCTGVQAPGALAMLGAAAATWAVWPRLPGGPKGLLLGNTVALLGFFSTAKQAFCNYYYFVGVLLLLVVATAPRAPTGPAAPADPEPPEPLDGYLPQGFLPSSMALAFCGSTSRTSWICGLASSQRPLLSACSAFSRWSAI